jgi:hypothetical protein
MVRLVPRQSVVVAGLMLIVGFWFTVTVLVTVVEQPLEPVPVIEYVVVLTGVAVTVLPLLVFKPILGDHA